MIVLGHYDDGKRKYMSHEFTLVNDRADSIDTYTYNPLNVCGYGESKEEALKDFIEKFKWVMKQWESFATLLLDTDVITDNIVEIDCFGNIKH